MHFFINKETQRRQQNFDYTKNTNWLKFVIFNNNNCLSGKAFRLTSYVTIL